MPGKGRWAMAYECKVYDKNGNLKKVVKENQQIDLDTKFLNQSSTKRICSNIKKLREPSIREDSKTKFYNKSCIVCQKEFHPRHPKAKYCSHECQKRLYLEKKKKLNSLKKGNPG
jgi:hypothetical protein